MNPFEVLDKVPVSILMYIMSNNRYRDSENIFFLSLRPLQKWNFSWGPLPLDKHAMPSSLLIGDTGAPLGNLTYEHFGSSQENILSLSLRTYGKWSWHWGL